MSIRKAIPDWAQSFLSTFYSTEEMEREASVNVKTLPKVVWNDNTFYVALDTDEGNADILNEYGNVVTALKNVSSMDEVEQRLNKQIIAEIVNTKYMNKSSKPIKLDDELEKVADTINQLEKVADDQASTTQSPVMQTTDPSINKSVDTVTNTPSNTTSDITNQQMDNAVQNDTNQVTATIVQDLKNQLQKTCSIIKNDQAKINKLQQKISSYEKKVAKMSGNIVKLASSIKKLQDQIHAYINPGNIYDLNCQEQELKHYTYTADESAKAINAEHKVDLTTPQGRVSLKDRILQDIESIKMPEEILTESVEVSPIEQSVNDNANEDTNNISINKKVTIVDNQPSISNTDISNDNDKFIKDDEDAANEDINTVNEDEEFLSEDEENLNEDNVEIVSDKKFLNTKESSIFKKQICPICKQSTLSLSTKTASIQNILCHNCNTKFGVNLNNEKIFKY